MDTFQFGTSATQLPIWGHRLGRSGPLVLILGGVHGNEPEGIIAAHGLLKLFYQTFTHQLRVTVVPEFNFDGVMTQSRLNSRGVDLNRNLPTKDWTKNATEKKYYPGTEPNSEPENQALVSWLEKNKPHLVISLHSWFPLLNINGNCRAEAEVISKITGYEIKEDIGYPTPGCLGTYCGLERDIPTLTYEIERGLNHCDILKIHVPALHEALKVSEMRL